MRAHGWVGLAIMCAGEALLYAGQPLVATFFTPLMWTGYILLVDGWVAARTGASWLTTRRREFGFLAVLSVLSWLLFEAYNFKLANWAYVGMPPQAWLRDLGFLWSFATITPAMFETADGLAAFRRTAHLWPELERPAAAAAGPQAGYLAGWAVLGLACVAVPPALPDGLAPYTFGLVWVGYSLLLEPVLLRNGQPSMLRLWRAGQRASDWALAAGRANLWVHLGAVECAVPRPRRRRLAVHHAQPDPQPGIWHALRQNAGRRVAGVSTFRFGELCTILFSALGASAYAQPAAFRAICPMTVGQPCAYCMMTDRAASDIFRIVLRHNVVVAVRSPRRPKPIDRAFGVFAC